MRFAQRFRWKLGTIAVGLLVVGSGQAMGDYVSEITSQNPLFYWRFNETTTGAITEQIDNSSTAVNNGSSGSNVAVGQASGNALTPAGGFDGFESGNSWFTFPAVTSSDFVAHLTDPLDEMSSTLGSVSNWIRTTTGTGSTDGTVGTMYRADAGATGALYTFVDSDGKFGLRITNQTGEAVVLADVRTTNSYNDDSWHHVAATWDETAGQAIIYVDGGAAAGGETVVGSFTTGVAFISTGRNQFGKGTSIRSQYQGSADELAIWTSVLSPADIQAQYASAFIAGGFHPGDANGDGMVNLADLQILGDNWQSTTATWSDADFTGDGNVNLADLQIIGDNWGFGTGTDVSFDEALAGVAIPEPASLLMLGISGLMAVSRRR